MQALGKTSSKSIAVDATVEIYSIPITDTPAFFYRSIKDFLFMVNERAAIERRYAEKLESWYAKWNGAISLGKC